MTLADLRNQRPYIKLNSRRVARIVQHALSLPSPIRIGRHPQSGRNKLYVLRAPAGRAFLAKIDALYSETSMECAAHLAIGVQDFVAAPLLVLARAHLCTFELAPDAYDLEVSARADFLSTLEHLLSVGAKSLALMHVAVPTVAPRYQSLIDFPLPKTSQIVDASEGFRQTLRDAQQMNLLERARPQADYPTCFSHGDIKLSNIVEDRGRPMLIDFEACCESSVGADAAGFVGLMFVACIRARSSHLAANQALADFRISLHYALELLDSYHAYLDRTGLVAPPDDEFDRMVARYLIERALSESFFRIRQTQSEQLMLEIASSILSHGLRAMGRAAY